MALFGLLKDKCNYRRNPIEKGNEIVAEVKVPGYIGTYSKKFCSNEHADAYKKEINKMSKKTGGSCCG